MIILPAIDLKDGKCVRLRQGRAEDVTVYGDDPAAQAKDWADQGGQELHVVDLDGAFAGTPKHAEVIKRIIQAFGGPVEVGGGLRTPEALDAVIQAGVTRAIIGSAALEDPEFLANAVELYGDKIAVGIDARNGFVQTKGWVETTKTLATELATAVAKVGVKTIIYTDTATDGMLAVRTSPRWRRSATPRRRARSRRPAASARRSTSRTSRRSSARTCAPQSSARRSTTGAPR